ncbi:MAG TPA: HAMP domain-containing sensor histidine kinase [Solirubrobacteraceae bacterium]|jgi:signal transduction histidine kinase|nr:HAMP domain-containing sensor histidine kinase [Solirubrobacteraceae bacterium]
MLLARLRWSAFGLRGRIVGAVLATTAISLGVAALVLLPRLEGSLKNASKTSLSKAIKSNLTELRSFSAIRYWLIPDYAIIATKSSSLRKQAQAASTALVNWESNLAHHLGVQSAAICAPLDEQGACNPVAPVNQTGQADPTALAEIAASKPFNDRHCAFEYGQCVTFSPDGSTVRAAIYLKSANAILFVRNSIKEIGGAVAAVRNAFEIAAGVAILLTILIAIPLAGRLVSRLQRLRAAALQLAIGGNVGAGGDRFPVDRARDEVGDLARSFSIMHRRLRQQEEARRAFVATASHELRTPLASLEGMLELLADDLQGEQPDLTDAAALLDRARVQSRRLARLAADLLDLSRIDAEVSLRSEPIELGELGRAVMAEFELPSSNRGVAITLDDDGKPAWALADPGSVARILRILLDNGLRVAPEGSRIRVLVRSRPEPMLVVSDDGPGVVQEERALIFERFKRGRETGGEAGFGLGLAIGRELAQRMGGSLVLTDSEAPGATFTLRLQPTEAPSSDRLASTAGV